MFNGMMSHHFLQLLTSPYFGSFGSLVCLWWYVIEPAAFPLLSYFIAILISVGVMGHVLMFNSYLLDFSLNCYKVLFVLLKQD